MAALVGQQRAILSIQTSRERSAVLLRLFVCASMQKAGMSDTFVVGLGSAVSEAMRRS